MSLDFCVKRAGASRSRNHHSDAGRVAHHGWFRGCRRSRLRFQASYSCGSNFTLECRRRSASDLRGRELRGGHCLVAPSAQRVRRRALVRIAHEINGARLRFWLLRRLFPSSGRPAAGLPPPHNGWLCHSETDGPTMRLLRRGAPAVYKTRWIDISRCR